MRDRTRQVGPEYDDRFLDTVPRRLADYFKNAVFEGLFRGLPVVLAEGTDDDSAA